MSGFLIEGAQRAKPLLLNRATEKGTALTFFNGLLGRCLYRSIQGNKKIDYERS